MTRIGITGSRGFLGWHLRCLLRSDPAVKIVEASRATFDDADALADFAAATDVIVHLAGMNRGDDKLVQETNIDITHRLVSACERASARPYVIFASSVQQSRHAAYGRSKRACTQILSQWADRCSATFTNLVLPHAFGECGKPFYNSAVATFCHQLANGEQPRVFNDIELELIHAQRVAGEIRRLITQPYCGEVALRGTPIAVSAVLTKLASMAEQYAQQVIPDVSAPFDLELFNTLRSYFFPARFPVDLTLRSDARGSLFEAVKTLHGGQCFISATLPGITRGNHYHHRKIERFLVLAGQADIRVRKLFSSDIATFHVSGERPQYVDMPAFHAHNITNTGTRELITLFWSHEIFDPANPDTYPERV